MCASVTAMQNLSGTLREDAQSEADDWTEPDWVELTIERWWPGTEIEPPTPVFSGLPAD